MELKIREHLMDDVVIVEPEFFRDERGFFSEAFRSDQFAGLGLPSTFVQDNHSGSTRHVARGLHFQYDPPMGKLMRVLVGRAFLTGVDIRKGSPTLGKWFKYEASADDRVWLWAPAGIARGFCSLSDWVELEYKCTSTYNSRGEGNILWNDPEIGIEWPVDDPIVSERDRNAPTLAEWLRTPQSDRFAYDKP